MRQEYKHVVGIETTSNSSTKDHLGMRLKDGYVEYDEFYEPTEFRKQSEDTNKRVRGLIELQSNTKVFGKNTHDIIITTYNSMLERIKVKDRLVVYYHSHCTQGLLGHHFR